LPTSLEGFLNAETLGAIASIVVIDLVLSGDNAVVIGMAAHRLPPHQQRRAILFGAGAAIGLRIIFTAMIAVLLRVPLLQLGGGILLTWIAFKLLRPESGGHTNISAADNQWDAIRTIAMADVVMSLDNILAVAGAAHGELWLLLFGLALSMPLIIGGSRVVTWAMDRAPWLAYVGSGVLAWTAAKMMVEDPYAISFLHGLYEIDRLIPIVLTAVILGAGWLVRRQAAQRGG
jgi:YjbE family integral membrane protein